MEAVDALYYTFTLMAISGRSSQGEPSMLQQV